MIRLYACVLLMPLVAMLLSLLLYFDVSLYELGRDFPLLRHAVADAVVVLLNTAAGGVVSVAIAAIFSQAVLLQAQQYTTLTPVCHVRRACTPPCSMCLRVAPAAAIAVVYNCYLLSAVAVTLPAAGGGSLSMLLLPPSSLLQLLRALLL